MIRKVLALLLMVGMMGCGSTGTSGKAAGPVSRPVVQNIPASSKFSNIKVGMGRAQTVTFVGEPDKTAKHQSGKAFIPFYHGNDRYHTTYYYHGEGRLEIDSDDNVVEIQYDPSETAGL